MKGKSMLTVAVLAGIGTGAFMMYKKKNPNMMNDMKAKAKDAAYKLAYSLDENF
ncbi:MAG: hypothetical protein HFJ38_04515 [Bacilli bacterium]|nr:hypothetical protein [Bacilli bacterium]